MKTSIARHAFTGPHATQQANGLLEPRDPFLWFREGWPHAANDSDQSPAPTAISNRPPEINGSAEFSLASTPSS